MSLAAPRTIELEDGRSFSVKPITVRQRLEIQNKYVERERKRAAADAAAAGMSGAEAAEYVTTARRQADNLGSLVMWGFTLDGILEILGASMGFEKAEELASSVDIKEASVIALAALGVDLDRYKDKPGNG